MTVFVSESVRVFVCVNLKTDSGFHLHVLGVVSDAVDQLGCLNLPGADFVDGRE